MHRYIHIYTEKESEGESIIYNDMAYADDVTVFQKKVHDLQTLFDICVVYSKIWGLKCGVELYTRIAVSYCSNRSTLYTQAG